MDLLLMMYMYGSGSHYNSLILKRGHCSLDLYQDNRDFQQSYVTYHKGFRFPKEEG